MSKNSKIGNFEQMAFFLEILKNYEIEKLNNNLREISLKFLNFIF